MTRKQENQAKTTHKKQSGSALRKAKERKVAAKNDTSKKTPRKPVRPKKENLTLTQRRQQEVRRSKIMIVCGVVILAVLLFLIFGLPRLSGSKHRTPKGTLVGVNSAVLKYKDTVASYCDKYDISEYATLMLAIMQQESSGQGTDVFQCSESPFNTEYSSDPNSITDTEYSIRVGVETFAYCLEQAECKSIKDMDKVKIALQEYNFGNDYAGWVLANYGTYTEESAYEFAEKMKSQLGWDSYGDPEYVSHVLQYFEP